MEISKNTQRKELDSDMMGRDGMCSLLTICSYVLRLIYKNYLLLL